MRDFDGNPSYQKGARHPYRSWMGTTIRGARAATQLTRHHGDAPRGSALPRRRPASEDDTRVRIPTGLTHAETEARYEKQSVVRNDAVSEVNTDHHKTMRVSTRRGPSQSPSAPLGISKDA